MPLVYLVSGANRGIGLGIVTALASRSDTIVFAGTRSPSSSSSEALRALAEAHPGVVHIVKLTAGDEADNSAAVERVREVTGRLDVVIANAGISSAFGRIVDLDTAALREHWEVNVAGPLVLFNTSYPLFMSPATPRTTTDPPLKFIYISSTAGSTALGAPIPLCAPYGASKAAANHLMRKLHFEHADEGLVVFPICPGAVETDMYKQGIEAVESLRTFPPMSVSDNAARLLAIIDGATRESRGGRFMHVSGEERPW